MCHSTDTTQSCCAQPQVVEVASTSSYQLQLQKLQAEEAAASAKAAADATQAELQAALDTLHKVPTSFAFIHFESRKEPHSDFAQAELQAALAALQKVQERCHMLTVASLNCAACSGKTSKYLCGMRQHAVAFGAAALLASSSFATTSGILIFIT